jgi:hypothetical protein
LGGIKLPIFVVYKNKNNIIMKLLNLTFKLIAFTLTAFVASGILWAIFALVSGEFTNATFGILG